MFQTSQSSGSSFTFRVTRACIVFMEYSYLNYARRPTCNRIAFMLLSRRAKHQEKRSHAKN